MFARIGLDLDLLRQGRLVAFGQLCWLLQHARDSGPHQWFQDRGAQHVITAVAVRLPVAILAGFAHVALARDFRLYGIALAARGAENHPGQEVETDRLAALGCAIMIQPALRLVEDDLIDQGGNGKRDDFAWLAFNCLAPPGLRDTVAGDDRLAAVIAGATGVRLIVQDPVDRRGGPVGAAGGRDARCGQATGKCCGSTRHERTTRRCAAQSGLLRG